MSSRSKTVVPEPSAVKLDVTGSISCTVTVLYTPLHFLTTVDYVVLFTKVIKSAIYTHFMAIQLTINSVTGCFFGKMIWNLISLARSSDRQSLVLARTMPASNIRVRGNR